MKEIINCIHNDEMGEQNAKNALCLIDPDDKCCKEVELRYCYYKQLQRLKQENEELKAKFIELYNNTEQLVNKYNKYDGKKENELVEIFNKTTDEKNKYRQTLEKIRENILSRYSIDKNKEIIARPLEDLWCIKKLIDEVLK